MLKPIDTNTILGAQAGKPEQVTKLYTYYHPGIYRYLYYRVGDHQTAEDLTSEVFLRMIRNLGGYRLQETAVLFQAWLFQIAHNLAADHFRHANRNPQVALEEHFPVDDPEHEAGSEYRLTQEALHQALSYLKDEQREVVVLRFIVGLPIADVARVLHRSDDAIKGLQRRGLAALKDSLADLEVSYA